jgi:hypothetical protein
MMTWAQAKRAVTMAAHRTAAESGHGKRAHTLVAAATAVPPDRGLVKGRNDLVERLVLDDGPKCTIPVWREHVAKNAGEAGRSCWPWRRFRWWWWR